MIEGWLQFVATIQGIGEECVIRALNAKQELVGAIAYDPSTGQYMIGVHPDCRRRGIGTLLLKAGDARWKLDFGIQVYSEEGLQLAIKCTGFRGKMLVAVEE
jgi:GNAT superfamily N-acetyltransferase